MRHTLPSFLPIFLLFSSLSAYVRHLFRLYFDSVCVSVSVSACCRVGLRLYLSLALFLAPVLMSLLCIMFSVNSTLLFVPMCVV